MQKKKLNLDPFNYMKKTIKKAQIEMAEED